MQNNHNPTLETSDPETNQGQSYPNTLLDLKEMLQALMNQMMTITKMLADFMIKIPLHSLH